LASKPYTGWVTISATGFFQILSLLKQGRHMVDYKIFFACTLTWVLCGVGFTNTAKALDIEVFTILPDGRMVSLPTGAFLYHGQRIRLAVKAEKTGRLVMRYFEGVSQAAEMSQHVDDPLMPSFFPSNNREWELTGQPGARRFVAALQFKSGEIEQAQWSGEYVVPNQVLAVAKKIRPDVVASRMPRGIAKALAKLKQISVRQVAPLKTRGKSEGSAIFSALAPSIVKIFLEDGHGSGVVVSNDGIIVTNYHVIEGNSEGAVLTMPRKGTYEPVFNFTIAGSFPLKDLAFIKVNFDKTRPVPPIKFGPSKYVDVGDQVYSIGHPLGHDWSLTRGIISAKRKNFPFGIHKGKEQRADVLQTQTPISSGNSGGALLNKNNELIGINTFSWIDSQNLNFAISADEVFDLLADLKKITKNKPKKPTLYPESGLLVKKIDKNDDGVFEIIIYNVFGHSEGDWFLVDVDEDGIIDRVDIDHDGDGYKEEHQRLQSNGSTYEKVRMVDNDADGKPDFMFVDNDLDGSWDTLRILN